MYPQPPNPTPPNPNDYDFIVNPAATPRRSLLVGSSANSRLVIAVVGLVILLVLFVGAKSILFSGSGNSAALLKVANQQQELITVTKVATSGSQQLSGGGSTIAITTQVSLTSDQVQLLAYLKTHGQKVSKDQLVYPGGLAITAQLAAASSAGTYELTLQQVLKNQLVDYQTSLKQAYAKTSGTRGRELLQKEYDGATILLRQFGTTTTP